MCVMELSGKRGPHLISSQEIILIHLKSGTWSDVGALSIIPKCDCSITYNKIFALLSGDNFILLSKYLNVGRLMYSD